LGSGKVRKSALGLGLEEVEEVRVERVLLHVELLDLDHLGLRLLLLLLRRGTINLVDARAVLNEQRDLELELGQVLLEVVLVVDLCA
jgi:hypothetical protein